jgi:spore germination cell wall hydrolase CwlJ-like protein
MRTALTLSAIIICMLSSANAQPEEGCLQEALYFEARSEGWRGMLAVGIVIRNRVASENYPSSYCGVVRQGYYRNGNPIIGLCQFSYWCDGKHERPAEKQPWHDARGVAKIIMSTEVEIVGLEGITHYHATWVRPDWIDEMKLRGKIGQHIFYSRVN